MFTMWTVTYDCPTVQSKLSLQLKNIVFSFSLYIFFFLATWLLQFAFVNFVVICKDILFEM